MSFSTWGNTNWPTSVPSPLAEDPEVAFSNSSTLFINGQIRLSRPLTTREALQLDDMPAHYLQKKK